MMKNLTREVNEISQLPTHLPHYCEYLKTVQSPCKKFVIQADNESNFIVVAIVLPFFTELSQD